jgi:DHA1 family multidrug resistance protein-like MFS transporter
MIIGGGTLADVWNCNARAIAVIFFIAGNFVGLVVGPVLGGFLVDSSLGWRWTVWIIVIPSGGILFLALFILPESYSLVILQRRARDIRYREQNWACHAVLDEERVGLREICTRYLLRPFSMLSSELILLLISIYQAFVYSLLYLLCEAYPIMFFDVRKWQNIGVAILPVFSVAIGICLGGIFVGWHTLTRFSDKVGMEVRRNGGYFPSLLLYNRLAEERLLPMAVGGIILPVGLFWFAATSDPHFSWVPQGAAGIFIGCGIFMIFIQGLNYVLDVYPRSSNTATAAVSFLRCLACSAAPLFGSQMFHGLGVAWASAILGFVSLALVPVPFWFLCQGRDIRARNGLLLLPAEETHPALRIRPPVQGRRLSLRLESLRLEIPPPVWQEGHI